MERYTPDDSPVASYREADAEEDQHSSDDDDDWSWKAKAGKTGVTLALTKTDFGPCKQDPSNTILTSRTRDVEEKGLSCSGAKLVCRRKLKNLNLTVWQNQL